MAESPKIVHSFDSREDLEAWAKSAFGGYEVIEVNGSYKEKLLFVIRSETSGIESASLSVYYTSNSKWFLYTYLRPHTGSLRIVAKANEIVVEKISSKFNKNPDEGIPVLILPIERDQTTNRDRIP